MDEGQLLLLWPGEVRRKREGDFGQIGPALLAGTNNCPSFINKIPSTSYSMKTRKKSYEQFLAIVPDTLLLQALVSKWAPLAGPCEIKF